MVNISNMSISLFTTNIASVTACLVLLSTLFLFLLYRCSAAQAIEDNILEWVSLLHMRTPVCTVMLVASHYDLLFGEPLENEKLLEDVERRQVVDTLLSGIRAGRCSSVVDPFRQSRNVFRRRLVSP